MARADSTIRVNIIGDAKGLQKELGKATGPKGLGGLGKLAGAIGIAAVTSELLDFGQTALNEADRAGDALTRLNLTLGPLSDSLDETAGNFERLGQSRQDILELEAAFADFATTAQLTTADIAAMAPEAAATAAALALLTDVDAATNMDLISKAAGGSLKAMKALGISVTDTEIVTRALADTGKANADQLTDSEKAAASYALVLEALKPRLDAVANSSGDVEQKQAELQARFETLTGKIGEGVEGPLNEFLGWTLAGVDGLGQLEFGIGEVIEMMQKLLGPIGQAIEGLKVLIGLFNQVPGASTTLGPHVGNRPGVSGGAGDRAVVNALNDYLERNGKPII